MRWPYLKRARRGRRTAPDGPVFHGGRRGAGVRFLVTGASGFVGSHLVPRLARLGQVTTLQRPDGPNVVPAGAASIVGDITVPGNLNSVAPMDVVVHLAAEASPERARRDPLRAQEVNVGGTRNVAELALRHGARLVFLSTGQVYGPSAGRPFTETDPPRPAGPYAESKAAAEAVLEGLASRGLRATTLRCFNMYGPRQVGPYVVPAILEAAAAGRTPVLRDLAPARDFLYVGDAVEAMALVAQRPDAPRVLNVASGRTVTIEQVAQVACRLAGVAPPTGPFHDHGAVAADVGRLRALGWAPRTPLEQGLAATLDWWRSRAGAAAG